MAASGVAANVANNVCKRNNSNQNVFFGHNKYPVYSLLYEQV